MSRSVTSVIDGERVVDGRTISSTNPAQLDDVVAEVVLADASTFTAAAASAKRAQPAWADIPPPVRGRAIAHIGRAVEDNAETLARLVAREIGKPYAEALGEVREIVDTCDFFLGEGRRLYGQTVPSEMPDKQLFTFRNPVGTVAVITAGNFPVAVPAWYIVPALLCGNTVVWKPAEYSAAAASAFHELFVRGGGLPAGVFNVVHADGRATYAGLEAALERGRRRQGRFYRVVRGRTEDRRTDRPPSADRLPRTRRQEPDGGHAERRPGPGRGRRAVLRVRHGWPALHVAGHGDRARVACTTSSSRRFTAAVDAGAVGDPSGEVLMGPLLDEKFAVAVRGVPRLDPAAPHGSRRDRPDHR